MNHSHSALRFAVLLAGLWCTGMAGAAETVRLPASACNAEIDFAAGFEDGEGHAPLPSGGTGGAIVPANLIGSAYDPALGESHLYYLRVPPGYLPGRPAPLILVLHGAAGPGTANTNASLTRNNWAASAGAAGAFVVAPVGSGSQGGWLPAVDTARVGAVLDDVQMRYNIDRSRIHVWGFSAGAHFAHGLALDNGDTFAAYAVNAGALAFYAGSDAPYLALRKLPMASFIGLSDPLLSYAREDEANFVANGWSADAHRYEEFNGGHVFPSQAQIAEIWRFLCPYAVDP